MEYHEIEVGYSLYEQVTEDFLRAEAYSTENYSVIAMEQASNQQAPVECSKPAATC